MYRLLILSVFFLLNAAGGVHASETLVFAIEADNPPYNMAVNGKAVGIDVETIRQIGQETGVTIKFIFLPWKRMLASVKSGAVDGLFPAYMRAERQIYSEYLTVPLRLVRFDAFINQKASLSYENPSSLKALNVGKIRGYSISQEFDAAAKAGIFNLIEVGHPDQGIKMLNENRIDVFVGECPVINYFAGKLGLSGAIKKIKAPINEGEGTFLLLSKASLGPKAKTLARRFDKALLKLKSNGTIERITTNFIKPDKTSPCVN